MDGELINVDEKMVKNAKKVKIMLKTILWTPHGGYRTQETGYRIEKIGKKVGCDASHQRFENLLRIHIPKNCLFFHTAPPFFSIAYRLKLVSATPNTSTGSILHKFEAL